MKDKQKVTINPLASIFFKHCCTFQIRFFNTE